MQVKTLVFVLVLGSQPCEWRLTVGQIRNQLPLTACYMWIVACHDVSAYRVSQCMMVCYQQITRSLEAHNHPVALYVTP